jgi:DNA polymerase IIIc chi subunit
MYNIIALAVALFIAAPQETLAQTNVRTQFNQAMAEFNALIMEQRFADALRMIRPGIEITDEEIAAMDNRFWELYPKNFIAHGTVRSQALKSGFRQEILAYWDEDQRYIYVYLLIHSLKDNVIVLNVDTSATFETLNDYF